ncbi:MAG: hypothetical protein ACK5JU_12820 [Bacteroidales bacterium]
MKHAELLIKLNELFGSYRAEWLKGRVYDYFTEPSYFIELKDNRPCVLQGGRGTGKTTVLKGLSYQGQYALHNNLIVEFDKLNFIGIYHRVNTNHVRAFKDGGLSEDLWQKIFGHYFSLIICREILLFTDWHKKHSTNDEDLSQLSCHLISQSLHLTKDCTSFHNLLKALEEKMYEFQSQINNIVDGNIPPLSMGGDPIKILTEKIIGLKQFSGKMFYILIDEYENLEDYQQKVINTLIKHNTEDYTFKIGVRELGWRIKQTLNPEESLYDPADYVLFDISEKLVEESHFESFAKKVCQKRIQELIDDNKKTEFTIEKSLQSISMENEALLLKVNDSEIMKQYKSLPIDVSNKIKHLTPLYKFYLAHWSISHKISLLDMIKKYLDNPSKSDSDYNNYKYSMLFKIRKGRGMVGIQKYYAGWNIFVLLSHGNIRYLMELVYRAYEKHIKDGNDLLVPISPSNQTLAAQDCGLKNLMELEGLSNNGAQLTRLLLGFGKIFNVLARYSGKIRPEVNQFCIKGVHNSERLPIITDAVMNLALIRIPGNKLNDVANTKESMYMLHPIYAAYFVYSHRKKRKLDITEQQLMDIAHNKKDIIKSILFEYNISEQDYNSSPDQLSLFEDYYND